MELKEPTELIETTELSEPTELKKPVERVNQHKQQKQKNWRTSRTGESTSLANH